MSPIIAARAFGASAYGWSAKSTVNTDFISVATAVGDGTSNVITFNTSGYTSSDFSALQVRLQAFGTSAGGSIALTFNGVTGTSYTRNEARTSGASSVNFTGTTGTSSAAILCNSSIATVAQGVPCNAIIDLYEPFSTTKHKSLSFIDGRGTSGTVAIGTGIFSNASKINSITLTLTAGNFATNTLVAFYGLKEPVF